MCVAAPVLNEIASFNAGLHADKEGSYPDWIEIHNPDSHSLDMSGWFLTDKPSALNRWAFPTGTTIPAGGFLIVFASGKKGITDELHANFTLQRNGEFLALVQPDGSTVVDSFTPSYPEVPKGASYGRSGAGLAYFATPTPGTANATGFGGYVTKPGFSHQRGHYTSSFYLTLTSPTPGAEIRYTVDGSAPTTTQGQLYSGPINISSTTVVRAVAYKTGLLSSKVSTHTFLLASSSVNQNDGNAFARNFPAKWIYQNPSWSGGKVEKPGDYSMDSAVVGDSRYDVVASLRSIPSISLALYHDHLFKTGKIWSATPSHGNDEEGIYVNPGGDWIGGSPRSGNHTLNNPSPPWERPASFEYIPAAGGTHDRQADCGLRMQGLSSTSPSVYSKLSFRAIFRKKYGEGTLNHNVFPNDPTSVNKHNSLILRAGSSDKWDHTMSSPVFANPQYIRDEFVRRSQLATGGKSARGTWVHVYLNGMYWGLYNLTERIDTKWAANYENGEEEDFILMDSSYPDSPPPKWKALTDELVDKGFVINASHYAAAASKLNMPAFADYMIINQIALTQDWPMSNWYMTTRVADPNSRWTPHVWDADQSLVNGNMISRKWIMGGGGYGINLRAGNPGTFWAHLRANPQFRELFADRLQKHIISGGVLSEAAGKARYQKLMNEVRIPLEAEAARWGDAWGQALRDPIDDWEPVVQSVRDSYLPKRMATIMSEYYDAGLLPLVDAPSVTPSGGALSPGDQVTISAPAGTTVYYTTDGSDPKTALNYSAEVILTASSSSKITHTLANTDPAIWSAPGFDDSRWTDDDSDIQNSEGYVRIPFTIDSQSKLDVLHGCACYYTLEYGKVDFYLNGQHLAQKEGLSGSTSSLEMSRFINILKVGKNVLGIKTSDEDLRIEKLVTFSHKTNSNKPAGTKYSSPISAHSGLTSLKVRAIDVKGRWSSLVEVDFESGILPGKLVVSELNYRPHNPVLPAETSVSTDRDDYEYIELMNIGTTALDLDGYFFSDGINFTFPPASIPAGGRILIVRDKAAFTARYGSSLPAPILGEYTGRLSNDGERIIISTSSGPVIDFTYNDSAPWAKSADGDGPSLTLIKPSSNPSHDSPTSWRLSSTHGGTPGIGDSTTLADWMNGYGISDPYADPDGDGMNNLWEYTVGSNPNKNNGLSGFYLSRHSDSLGDRAAIDLTLNLTAVDEVKTTIEKSSDLKFWKKANVEYVGEVFHGNNKATLKYRSTDTMTGAGEFFRAKVQNR